ncbi:helix-turn-helix domain-containing protein [Chryseobacterium camelliae]|uniref:Helix-turn-helix domain-containing protein n=1 Tax=Chryseobacterium camelliae TaxID=1265445 RepID=A0ABY7QP92_9FLAO|nr:helix-turn-helix domain-containing protein [Chryseobacterium camelliae]WBV61470.1 helix-turn-helix domain-containing protein [Chryseobacterium camelliae]
MPRNKRNILLLIFIFYSIFTNGQSGPDFSILADKAFQKLYQNPDDCISYSQSLLLSDQNIEHKLVLQNIISQAYAMKGDYVQSVSISTQQEDFQQNNLSYFMQAFGNYNLAEQYQNLDLYDQSKKIIAHLLSDQNLLKSNDPSLRITVAKIYQLQALNLGINRDYPSALKYLTKSDQYTNSSNEENIITQIENKIFRSSYLLRQNKLNESKKLTDKVIAHLEKYKEHPFLLSLAYETLSRYYFLKQDYTTSVSKSEMALSQIESLPFSSLKIKIYESLSRNYFALHDDVKYHQYNKLYINLTTKEDSNTKEGIRYIVKLAETNQNKSIEFQKQNYAQSLGILLLIVTFIILALLIYFLIIKSKNKDLKKQFDFFEKQSKREQKAHSSLPVIKEIPIIEKNSEKDSNKISKEKEEEILQKLEEFEQSDRFLNKSMSLSLLSSQMEINTKYLSEVINTHKEKNFNGYINELRINHIAHLLRTDSVFLNYKVSYLAEYSGFSSHSTFTTVFKSVTGMSPNTYIQEISKSKIV